MNEVKWAVCLTKKLSTDWEWALIPIGFPKEHVVIKGCGQHASQEEASLAAKTFAKETNLSLYKGAENE